MGKFKARTTSVVHAEAEEIAAVSAHVGVHVLPARDGVQQLHAALLEQPGARDAARAAQSAHPSHVEDVHLHERQVLVSGARGGGGGMRLSPRTPSLAWCTSR
jgi:hypothetical protein